MKNFIERINKQIFFIDPVFELWFQKNFLHNLIEYWKKENKLARIQYFTCFLL